MPRLKTLLIPLVFLSFATEAREIALMIFAFKTSELTPGTFATNARSFRRAYGHCPEVVPLAIEAHSPERLIEGLAALDLSDDDRISRVYLQGHGAHGLVGDLFVFDPATVAAYGELGRRLGSAPFVFIEACSFLPADPVHATVLMNILKTHLRLDSGALVAQFANTKLPYGPRVLEPFWRFARGSVQRRRTLLSQLVTVMSVGASASAIYDDNPILSPFTIGITALQLLALFDLHVLIERRTSKSFRYDVGDEVGTARPVTQASALDELFRRRECEAALTAPAVNATAGGE